MSSFDFADNFSGFNDLFNRAEFLTEAKKSPYAKYHPSFGSVTKDLRSAGFSSAPLDTINFIRTALYDLHLISDDELAAAKKGAGFAAKKNNLLALLDAKADVIEQNKDEIAKEVEDNLARYINRATTNRGREEKYAAQKAALELAKDIKAGEDVGDAVEDTVGQLDAAESELAQSLEMSKEDPTTFIEIKIRDAGRIEDVGNIVSKYANEDGLDISGDTVQFSVDPDTPLANAVTAHGIDKIEAALKRDVDKISDSVVVVMAPDEDYEEMGYGFDSPEEPDEYSMGEEGGGITEVEDAEDEFNRLENKREHARGRAREAEDKGDWDEWNRQENERERARDQLRDSEDNELDHFLTKEQPEDYIPSTDYEDVLDDLVNKDKKKHAMKKLNGDDDPGHIDDMRAEYPPDPFGGGYEDEESIVMQPMLESHKTNTSAYLSEQTASDKRNKKTEVKNQSFKEKYKPKTHWQLEELRRYGL